VLFAITPLTALDASRSANESQSSRFQGNVSQAIGLGLRATGEDPRRAEYWQTLGLAYVAGNKLREAAAALDRASKLSPYDVRFLGDEARAQLVLAQAGNTAARAEAIRIADQAIKTDPNNPRSELTKAVTMQVTGDLPQALAAVRRALALDPQSTNAELYISAAQIMSASGQTSDSIRVSRDGIGILGQAPSSVALRIELARALMASGQLAEALKEIDVALDIVPGEPTATRVRVDIQAAMARGV
jgi:tetratricopeptide (TPR) repeat protein